MTLTGRTAEAGPIVRMNDRYRNGKREEDGESRSPKNRQNECHTSPIIMAHLLMFMAGPMRCRLWLSLVVGVLVLIGSPIAQTPGQHDDGDRVPFLDDYVGQYELTPNFILNVMRVGDALYVQGPRQSATQMHAQTQTEYVVAASRLRIIFGVNLISREVDHLIFEQDGVGRRAEKVFEIVANAEAHAREIAPDTLERYEGTYEGRPGFTITISLEDGRLWAGMEGQPRRTLLPTSETDFLYENSSARLSFEVGTAGKVEGLILHQGGGSDLSLDRKD